jgi:hypothetical protein
MTLVEKELGSVARVFIRGVGEKNAPGEDERRESEEGGDVGVHGSMPARETIYHGEVTGQSQRKW